jgi:hypothetical protein
VNSDIVPHEPLQRSPAHLLYPRVVFLTVATVACILGRATAAEFTTYCPGEANLVVSREGEDFLRFGTAVWGPNWSWAGVSGKTELQDGAAVGRLNAKVGDQSLQLAFRAARKAANIVELSYELRATNDVALTLFVVELAPGKFLEGREVAVETTSGAKRVKVPFGRATLGEQVSALRISADSGKETVIRLDPPCEVSADGAARIVLAKDQMKAASPRRLIVTLELPANTDWYPSIAEMPQEPGLDNWYVWQGTGAASNSVFGMANWLDKPAGKHGRIKSQGAQLVYDGKPIKLWGVNVCYAACAPEKSLAEKRATFYAQYGINTVRLHKFADGAGWNGFQSKDSAADYDPAGLERFDYQVAKFKEAGIYVKLSAHFGTIKIGPADRGTVPFAEEFGTFDARKDRVSAPHSAFFYSRELQDLHIQQMVNLLKHKNPHTGFTYAEEPAVCAIETINEQSVLFYTSMAPLKQSPTLRAQVGKRFSEWLKSKYVNHDGLLHAWGAKGLDGFEKDGFPAGEHLDKANILPLGNPWYWDPAQIHGSQQFRKKRLLDTLQFLYELQSEAYERYVAALRKAGYSGEILGSNWQAGRGYSHFANLHTDAQVGLIDRHNYFGGGGRGKFNNASMLSRAGSGELSSGLQQVEDRPFMLSEWIHVFPNEWGVEGPALVGAYGMGLQGWDVSYMFQNGDNATFSRQLGGNAWDVVAPQVLGIFPAVSRQVLSGDVKESSVVARHNVHVPSLFEGKLGFEDKVVQGYDDKEFDSSKVPARTLAAARTAVRFTERPEETPAFDLKAYEPQSGEIVSSTKQLRWKEGTTKPSGYFTINSEGTKAVVGFAKGETCPLGEVTIAPQSKFAAIYVSALEPGTDIASGRKLLVSAIARARNNGMKFNLSGDKLLERGKGPITMEPVQATLKLNRHGSVKVTALDHDGRRTETMVPVTNGTFTIDGSREKTPYYLVEID